jgi:hypothetical protein
MACHPLVSAFSIDLSAEGLPNDALSELFQAAEDNAPALVILEDLDRIFGVGGHDNRTAITLRHLLACLDGLAMQNGLWSSQRRTTLRLSIRRSSSGRAGSIDSLGFLHHR